MCLKYSPRRSKCKWGDRNLDESSELKSFRTTPASQFLIDWKVRVLWISTRLSVLLVVWQSTLPSPEFDLGSHQPWVSAASSAFPTRLQLPKSGKSVLGPNNYKVGMVSNIAWRGRKQGKGCIRLCLHGEALTKGWVSQDGWSQEALPFQVLIAAPWILPWEKVHSVQWDTAGAGWASESLFELCANGIKEMSEVPIKNRLQSQEGKFWGFELSVCDG